MTSQIMIHFDNMINPNLFFIIIMCVDNIYNAIGILCFYNRSPLIFMFASNIYHFS